MNKIKGKKKAKNQSFETFHHHSTLIELSVTEAEHATVRAVDDVRDYVAEH